MDISLILSWSGVPIFFFTLMADIVYSRGIRHEPFFSNPYYVLGMIQSYCYMLSILIRLLFVYDPTDQMVISQGVYVVTASIYYSFVVFILIENKYDLFDTIPVGVKLITIISWVASTIIFILVAADTISVNIEIEGIKTQEFFYIDFLILIITMAMLINFIKCKKDLIFGETFNKLSIILLFIASSLWTSSIIYDILDIGSASLLKNIPKACISFFNWILSFYIISKNIGEHLKQSQNSQGFQNIRSSFHSVYSPPILGYNPDDYLNTS